MRRIAFAAAGLLGAVLATPTAARAESPAADPATAAKLAAYDHAQNQLNSVQADVLTETYAPGMQTVGRVVLRGDEAYSRIGYIDEAGEHVSQEMVITRDDRWTYHHVLRVATHIDRARLREAGVDHALANPVHGLLDVFAKAAPGTVQYLGPVTEADEALDHFRITATVAGGPPGELLVWADPAHGLPRRLELRSATGRLLLERAFVNLKVNAIVPDGLFELTIPPDVEVHELTDEYLKRHESDTQESSGTPEPGK